MPAPSTARPSVSVQGGPEGRASSYASSSGVPPGGQARAVLSSMYVQKIADRSYRRPCQLQPSYQDSAPGLGSNTSRVMV